MSFLKHPATPAFTWHLWKHGNWISEAAEIAAALLSLQALHSVSAMLKFGNTEFVMNYSDSLVFGLLCQLSIKWFSPLKRLCRSWFIKNNNFLFPYADSLIYSLLLLCGQITLVLFLTKKPSPLIHNLIHSLNWLHLALLYANKCPEAFYSQIGGSLHYQQFGN